MIATTTKNKVTCNIVSTYAPKFEKTMKFSEQTNTLINSTKKRDVIIITKKFGNFFKIF